MTCASIVVFVFLGNCLKLRRNVIIYEDNGKIIDAWTQASHKMLIFSAILASFTSDDLLLLQYKQLLRDDCEILLGEKDFVINLYDL